MRRRPLVLVLGALTAFAGPVAAHAWLETSDPPVSGHTDLPPTHVLLHFSEHVEREFTGATVMDVNGSRVDAGRVDFYPGGHQDEIDVPLNPIRDGLYTVKWQALSIDTHTASGSYVFAVGAATLQGAPPPTSGHHHGGKGPAQEWSESILRGAFYAGLAVVIGLPVFLLGVWAPTFEDRSAVALRRREFLVGGTASILASVAGIGVLIGFADGIQLTPLEAAQRTHTGLVLLARAAAAALAVVPFAFALTRVRAGFHAARPWLFLAAACGVVSGLSTSLSSHAASSTRDDGLPILADFSHVLAASIWIGGLAGLLLVLPRVDHRHAGRLVARFSPLAVVCVAIVLLTGTYGGLLHVRRLADLWRTQYGAALSVKVLCLAALVLFGAFNKYVLGPGLVRGRHERRSLRRSVVGESVFFVVVLLAAGVLATAQPPDQPVLANPAGPTSMELARSFEKTHVLLDLSPAPVRVGMVEFLVSLHPLDAPELPNGTTVWIQFQPPGQGERDEVVRPEKIGSGQWYLKGGFLTERGSWTVHVYVQRPDEFDHAPFEVNVQ